MNATEQDLLGIAINLHADGKTEDEFVDAAKQAWARALKKARASAASKKAAATKRANDAARMAKITEERRAKREEEKRAKEAAERAAYEALPQEEKDRLRIDELDASIESHREYLEDFAAEMTTEHLAERQAELAALESEKRSLEGKAGSK